jgi:CHAT domain-containing protein/tetratricopeptide (TPR) repeat protein
MLVLVPQTMNAQVPAEPSTPSAPAEPVEPVPIAQNCGSVQASNRLTVALDYVVLGRACKAQGQRDAAIAAYRRAIELDPNLAIAYNNLGVILAEQGLLGEAIRNYTRATELDPNLGNAYRNWADALRMQGRANEAATIDEAAIAAFRNASTAGGENLIRLGNELNRQRRLDEAIEAYRLAVEINPNLIAAHNNLGNTLLSRGRSQRDRQIEADPAQAQAVYRDALEDAVSAYRSATQVTLPANPPVNYRVALTRAYDGLGFALMELGRTDEATQAYDDALTSDPRLSVFPDPTQPETATGATAEDFNYLGRVLRNQSRREQAIAAYRRAIELNPDLAAAYNNLGVILAEQGQLEPAIEYYRKASELDPTPVQFVNLGNALRGVNRVDEALEAYQGIDGVLDRIEKLPTRVEDLNLLDTLLSGQRNFDWYQSRAQFFAQNQNYYANYIDLLMQLHKLYPTRGLDVKALEVSERARARGLLETLAEANVCQTVDNAELAALIREECRLQREFKRQVDAWNRLNTTQRGIPPLQQVEPGGDTAVIEEGNALETETLIPESAPLPAIAQDAAVPEDEKAAVEQRIRETWQAYEQVQAQIRAVNPDYAELAQPRRLTIAQIQSEVLDQDTVLLEYWLDEGQSYLWFVSQPGVISPTGIASYVLPSRADINQAARAFYNALTVPSERVKTVRTAQIGMRLSQMILGDVADQLGDRRLLIVADGMLRYIPFSALPEPSADDRFVALTDITNFDLDDLPDPMLVQHEIVNSPSASTLATLHQRLVTREPAPRTLAVIADPVLDRGDARFPQAETSSDAAPDPNPGADTSDPLTRGESVFPRLPGTSREAAEILEIADDENFEDSFKTFLGFDVNRAVVSELTDYRLIHFATHGVLDDRSPGQSGLVLSQFDAQGALVPNAYLNMNDIFNLDLPADLVVLSSCRTGLGTEVTGEGLVGLTQGFLRAGAGSVVVSLWSVHDEATSVLMQRFYQEMLDNLEDDDTPATAQALRAAQLELWNSSRWSTPYYWAAFTVQGEWR